MGYRPLHQLEIVFVFCHGLDYRISAGLRS